MLTKEETEKRCGFQIPDGIWRFRPWGNRILVRRLPPAEKFGSIEIPASAQRPVAAGTIVAVGDGVGYLNGLPGQAQPPRLLMDWDPEDGWFPDPDRLVGMVVTFTYFGGEAILPSVEDSLIGNPYDTDYVLIQAVDIWGHNEPPSPPSATEEEMTNGIPTTKEG